MIRERGVRAPMCIEGDIDACEEILYSDLEYEREPI